MSRAAAIDVLFSFNFAVVFDFMYFCFRPSKAKWIGNVLTNRRNAAKRSMFFSFSFILRIAYWRTESFCVIRQSGVNRKKAREILTGYYRRYNIVARCLMAQGASLRKYISASSDIPSLVLRLLFKKMLQVFAAFCLFVRTLPIHFALLGRKRKYIKSKTTAKL